MAGPSPDALARDRELLEAARRRGPLATLAAFVKLSGPGWLQSAITLGGGSLAGSLYLGVLGGYDLLWLQPLMMILGVVMLSAIAYVTLSTGEKPFGAINRHISPVLGWGWIIAATMANLVWAMPQFSLGTAAIQQNLLPDLPLVAGRNGEWVCAGLLFLLAAVVIWFYDSGSRGVKVFERILKAMVGVVVVSFFGVVAAMTAQGQLDWGRIAAGFVPDLSLLWRPVSDLQGFIDASGNPAYWSQLILGQQRSVMIAAAATAVGINMTFLLPYSMLRKGWDRSFRGLAAFDLSTGLFIPFLLATSSSTGRPPWPPRWCPPPTPRGSIARTSRAGWRPTWGARPPKPCPRPSSTGPSTPCRRPTASWRRCSFSGTPSTWPRRSRTCSGPAA